MSFLDVEDSVSVKIAMFSEDSEVMMLGKVSTLDVELIEHMSWSCMLSPNFLNVGVLEFMMPVVVMLADLATK